MLNLERSDLLQLEPISYRNTLKLLPLGKKNKQKLIIGDDSGQIGCYEFKKGEPQVVFQAKPFEGPITCIELGGNPQKRDKLFASHSQRIVGLTKKGKDFFKLTSSLTETIQQIATEDTRIWTSCEYLHNLYDNGKEMAYYISPGQINTLLVCHLTRENEYDTILACHDRYIRILHVSTPFTEIPTKYPVVSIAHLEIDKHPTANGRHTGHLIYGTSKGSLGYLRVEPNGTYEQVWEIDDDDKRSPINGIKLYDINKDKYEEVIIGRDDGRIEVYKLSFENNLSTPPTKIFTKDLSQSIRSIECGIVNTQDYPEIIVSVYSGKVISFTTEPIRNRSVEDTYGRSIQTVNNENRIKTLKKEIDELKKKVEKEKEKVKKAGISAQTIANFIKPPSDFPVNSSFDLDYNLAAYVLNIELQMSIDLIILRSPVVLDLVETDTGSSVLSVTPPAMNVATGNGGSSNEDEGKFVAVFRCQSNEKRISLTLRSNEGEYGDLMITIVAASNPKVGKVIRYELKPLSLHAKVHELTNEENNRPRNKIRYSGSASMATLHEWVQSLFPDVPARIDENVVDQKYYFRNAFTSAVALCEFRKNEIIVESESASTIAIAKETITRLANYRRITLDEFVNAHDPSVIGFLGLIREKLEYQLSLARKIQLVDAIQELSIQDNNSTDWLSPEYVEILRDQENIRRQYKNRDRSLEYLAGIITDLYVDWNRIQGTDMRHKIPQLQNVILNTNNDFQQIIKFFNLKV